MTYAEICKAAGVNPDPDFWWRCEPTRKAHWDAWYEHMTGYTYGVRWRAFRVEKVTPCGVRLREMLGVGFPDDETVFVLGHASKQVAVPTPELALRDALYRAKLHIAGCKARLSNAEALCAALKNI